MAFFSWDLGSDKVYGDPFLAELFGIEPSALISGLPILALVQRIAEIDRPRIAKAIHTAIRSGEVYREAYRIEHPDGKTINVVAVGRCLLSPDGIPSLYNGTVILAPDGDLCRDGDPLLEHCRAAIDLASERGNELAARYLSSALRAAGG